MRGIFTFFTLLVLTSTILAQSTQGPNPSTLQSTATLTGSTATWSTPSGASTSGGTFARVTLGQAGKSNYLTLTNFNFNIPASSTISGIQVNITDRYSSNQGFAGSIRLINQTGIITSFQKTFVGNSVSTTFTSRTLGGSGDLWGSTFSTPSVVNNSNFGIAIEVNRPNQGNQTTIYDVDYATITIYYTIPTPTATDNNYFPITATQSVSGNVLTDPPADSDPNNATLTANIDNRSEMDASGTFTFNSNGSFSFTPSASFLGGPISFTYHVTNNSNPPLSSSIATVTLNYPERALPVEFISFDARQTDKGVQLHWEVGTEVNVNHYDVERSTDGVNYKVIGSENATQNSSYNYTDLQPVNGVAYYRIRNVDQDGSFKYSTVVKFKNGLSTALFKAFPTTTKGLVTLQHPSVTGNAWIIISNMDGKTLRSFIPANGSVSTPIDLSNYPSGTYMLRYQGVNGHSETFRIIKQ
ncbi:Ig-like domain-containing protein [Flavisolibacter tropicus]|uniref:Secretion system C-terminal sorting domain-containing protein n=1 Tax=Flavisolibacter tropicus TaxID=1492898 RepID=A0A172TU18_9BACT|nr:Ig-like domain-containing protein [Flavisolibacter tropicus]ANE50589.1 hypothetical protein SY85_08810 [Flavisolibacter tropicus]